MGEIVRSAFRPPLWLRNAHLQTLWGPLGRSLPEVARHSERLDLADGDFLLLDWAGPRHGPGHLTVILLHGLSGCSDSHYMRGIQKTLAGAGIRSVAINSRGAKGPNDTALCYHAGETDDVDAVIEHVFHQDPTGHRIAIGVSLGGSRLLNWLIHRDSGRLAGVATVCAPLRLDLCANRLDRGLSRLYRGHLLKALLGYLDNQKRHLDQVNPAEAKRLYRLNMSGIRSFWRYDDQIIAPLYGFRGASHYYAQCSAGPRLQGIRTPTLLMQNRDDPFMTPETLPRREELGPAVTAEISDHGGHVGFVGAENPYWLEQRLLAWVQGFGFSS
ncbi:MAG: alpha/beta fold hydrolase [Pseudomonadales bacterium]|uniref:YheT family hydrolase n=1 Tax=Alcanivorax TaxID=59753 RepID=UPI0003B41850|nr:alpha/beta fold hydrolase [Alcanivorax sp. P2S70]ERP89564.1 alpha/beta hydrolase [Alcanivorax sp. P2S70]MCG8438124.1 alpha/beta fold hydrolase [Pseudomonadales bacterium]MEE2869460.1 alpha/beta fold hydrolase [Pseudomonadota bacterium]